MAEQERPETLAGEDVMQPETPAQAARRAFFDSRSRAGSDEDDWALAAQAAIAAAGNPTAKDYDNAVRWIAQLRALVAEIIDFLEQMNYLPPADSDRPAEWRERAGLNHG
jgi:hypothetical protein